MKIIEFFGLPYSGKHIFKLFKKIINKNSSVRKSIVILFNKYK